MAEQLYTIPINEAFDEYDGCPMCRLHAKLEDQSLSYIMGAAMMEPDIRVETNRLGFCHDHYHRMLKMGNRLSFALILQTHTAQISSLVSPQDDKKPGKLGKLKKYDGETPAAAILEQTGSCYVCQRVAGVEERYLSNVVYIWKKDPAFREKLKKQPYLCMEHTARLLEYGKKDLSESNYLEFEYALLNLAYSRLEAVHNAINGFVRSFDHENAGKPLTEVERYAVENAVAFLSGDAPERK